jgi:hypothetical protein
MKSRLDNIDWRNRAIERSETNLRYIQAESNGLSWKTPFLDIPLSALSGVLSRCGATNLRRHRRGEVWGTTD